MNWGELRRLAESKGWKLLRNGARHDIYFHPDRDDIMVLERHSNEEVRNGLMKKLLKQILK